MRQMGLALAFALLLASCGFRGALVLPDAAHPSPSASDSLRTGSNSARLG
jgi:predicted small lipoprotein YifL